MDAFLVVVVDIVFQGGVGFGVRVVRVEPDFFFFKGAEGVLDEGVVIGRIVAGVLAPDPARGEEFHEAFGAGLRSVVTAQDESGAKLPGDQAE